MTVKRYPLYDVPDGTADVVLAADHDAALAAKDTVLDALNNELNVYVKHLGAKDAEIAALRYVIDERMVEHHDYSVSLLERITALEAENAALRERAEIAERIRCRCRSEHGEMSASCRGYRECINAYARIAALKAAADKTEVKK